MGKFYIIIVFLFFSCSNDLHEIRIAYTNKDYKKVIRLSDEKLKDEVVYKEAIKLYELRGLSYYELKDYQNASNDLYKVITSGNSGVEVNEKVCLSNIYLGKIDFAILGFTDLIKYDSINPSFYYHRAEAYVQIKEYDKAKNDLLKSILLDSSKGMYYNDLGMVYQTQLNDKKAIPLFSKAIKLTPYPSGAYFNRGISYYYLNKLDSSLSDFNKSIEFNNQVGIVYYNRALLYMELGKKDKCCSDLNQAIKLGYTDVSLKIKQYCSSR